MAGGIRPGRRQAVFFRARDKTAEASRVVDDPAELSDAARDYLALDANNAWGDGTWEELKEFGKMPKTTKYPPHILIKVDGSDMISHADREALVKAHIVGVAQESIDDLARRNNQAG